MLAKRGIGNEKHHKFSKQGFASDPSAVIKSAGTAYTILET